MRYLRESTFLRAVLPLTLVLWLSACHKWVELAPPYGPAIEAAETREFRLTAAGERRLTESATLRHDTVWAGTFPIPLKDLEAVEVRKTDIFSTSVLAILGAATASLLVFIAVCYEGDCISGLGN